MGSSETKYENELNCINFVTNVPIGKSYYYIVFKHSLDTETAAISYFVSQGAEFDKLTISMCFINIRLCK